ncbi:MAG: DoxX family protein [Longimicrobiales bacterium]
MRNDAMQNAGLTLLRVVTGLIFAMHGWQKLFQFGLEGVTSGFAEMGVPLPAITAPGVSLLELVGGIALIVGLLTRVFSALLAIDMIGAILIVHLAAGFFLPEGYEFALIMFAASAALALMGAGAWSVDHVIASRRNRTV